MYWSLYTEETHDTTRNLFTFTNTQFELICLFLTSVTVSADSSHIRLQYQSFITN
jgi:hypothetical protein